jgi:hypothetical protein
MAKGKQITPSQGTSKTKQTTGAPAPQAKRTGGPIPEVDIRSVEPGYGAQFMVPGVPARNTPTAALTEAERSLPIRPTPATKAMAAARTKNSTEISGPGTAKGL